MNENIKPEKRDWLLPGSIVIAAVLISVSLLYNAGSGKNGDAANLAPDKNTPTTADIRSVSSEDHILGSASADIIIVEYSDLECPFCKRFHPVMKQVLASYGSEVAWVYRHLPLDSLHSKARKEAEATECAAELGGNDAFWAYVDKIFEVTPSNNGLDLTLLPKIAKDIGLDEAKFTVCLDSGKYASKIQSDVDDATKAGARGTPFSLVLKDKKIAGTIPGALPFDQVKLLIDAVLE
ncbi:MAG TPA: DsbA family protein [Candidatus Paceibacterota bacterium]|nr:DsbA family protein [Candidatus Paceibacterota bacterium]